MVERSVARLLLRSAEHDRTACRVLAAAGEVPDTIVGFHAQQACEKCPKAGRQDREGLLRTVDDLVQWATEQLRRLDKR